MKPLSLLSTLMTKDTPKVPVETSIPEPEKTQYRVYVLESEERSVKIGVPVDMVEAFDQHFAAKPEDLVTIDDHLATFNAILVE